MSVIMREGTVAGKHRISQVAAGLLISVLSIFFLRRSMSKFAFTRLQGFKLLALF